MKKALLCRYCKGAESFQFERSLIRWGVRCQLSPLPIRSFDTEEQTQQSIDEWCTGDGRRGCRPYLLRETGHSYSFDGDLIREFEAMEEATVAKQKYYCKCGKVFEKSSTAQDTGYRIMNYDEQHECYGCPFIEPVTDGWGSTLTVKAHECRASADKVKYITTASMALDSDYVAHIYTLNMPWLDHFINFYLDTPGCARIVTDRDPDRLEKAFRNASLYNGCRCYGFEFEKNKKGRAARKIVYDEFFDANGKVYQLGCGPSDERVQILQMIEHAKQAAREGVDDMAKLDVPEPSETTCPYYKGIKTTLSPKGYCIDCKSKQGWNQPYELKSWALDQINKNCINKDEFPKCRFFQLARAAEQGITVDAPPTPSQKPPEAPPALPRNITDITAEIRFYKAQTVSNIIEIGKRLLEAKAMLEHGQWEEWLENSVELGKRTAQNFMKIADEYSKTQPVAFLNYTSLIALLAVPADERDEFIEVPHNVDGIDKTVDEMSKRELQKVIKERDEAKAAAKQNEALALQRRRDIEKQITTINELRQRSQRLQGDLDKLESKPIDVAVQQPTEAQLEAMREEVREELRGELAVVQPTETYLSKKALENADGSFYDAVMGAEALLLGAAGQMDVKRAGQVIDGCVSVLEAMATRFRQAKNSLLEMDRQLNPDSGDVDF